MTSLERLNARLEGKPVDKIPNMNLFMHIVAREAGASYREYATDYRKLVEGNLICAEKYGVDSVSVISDPMREASAFGAKLTCPEHSVPYAETPLIGEDHDLSVLKRFDPYDSERTLDRIKGCELLRQKVGNDYPVIGWVEGCLAEAADLRDVNEFLLDLATEEDYIPEFLEIIFEQAKRFAKAQIDAGADFIGVGNAVASLIGPELYKKYGFKYDKALADYIHSCGAREKLHICGNITKLLEMLREVGPDILDLDWMVDYAEAAVLFKDTKTAISGNIDPSGVFFQGSTELMEQEVNRCLRDGNATSLVAGGCEIPAATPDENLTVMDRLLYC
jgi:uroporphyrinogen decarboxylase